MSLTSSIAMITYNGEKYLQRQLDSLANQTTLPDELVVCDDGSVDETMSILGNFAKTSPFPVKIYRNDENIGVGLNFRKAFFLCESDITFFCDQDDVWFPGKIAKTMELFQREQNIGMILMNDTVVDANENPIWYSDKVKRNLPKLIQDNSFDCLMKLKRFGWAAHAMACRTCWRDKIFTNAPPMSEIFDIWVFRTLGALSEVRIITDPTMLFRRHGGSVTSHSKNIRNPFILLYNSLKRHQQIDRIFDKAESFRQVSQFLKTLNPPPRPEIIEIYDRCTRHFDRSVKSTANPCLRIPIVLQEYFNGNYSTCGNGISDLFSDLFAFPQKNPQEALSADNNKP